VEDEIIENLDLLVNIEVLEQESIWDEALSLKSEVKENEDKP
jgi:hypothetical protein